MPRACCVPKCRTGHRRRKNEPRPPVGPKPSLHLFPRDRAMRELWRESIPFYKHNPGDHTYICSLHFLETDYASSTDQSKVTLRKGAVPSIFPELLDLQAKLDAVSVENYNSLCSVHDDNQNENLEDLCGLNEIQSLQDLDRRMNIIPPGIVKVFHEGTEPELIFLKIDPESTRPPCLHFSLKIDSSLHFEIWCNQLPLHKSKVEHIMNSERIKSIEQVFNLLEFLKAYAMSEAPPADKVEQGLCLIQEGTWNLPESKRVAIQSLLRQVKAIAS